MGKRVLLLDGAFGTMTAAGHSPRDIHRAYLHAGADIIETGLMREVSEARRAARTAREIADEYTRNDPGRPRFVAGALHADAGMDTSAAANTVEALVGGGADIIMLETTVSTEGVLRGAAAIAEASQRSGQAIRAIVSATLTPQGTLPSGESIGEFCKAAERCNPLAVGFNCSFGAEAMLLPLVRLAETTRYPVAAYPSAGLPDSRGDYAVSPERFAAAVAGYLERGTANIVGGCCGTTPAHIAALAGIIGRYAPRPFDTLNRERR